MAVKERSGGQREGRLFWEEKKFFAAFCGR